MVVSQTTTKKKKECGLSQHFCLWKSLFFLNRVSHSLPSVVHQAIWPCVMGFHKGVTDLSLISKCVWCQLKRFNFFFYYFLLKIISLTNNYYLLLFKLRHLISLILIQVCKNVVSPFLRKSGLFKKT